MISLNYKAQFQRNTQLVKMHKELVVSDGFQITVEMALLQYVSSQQTSAPAEAALAMNRILGAQEFIRVLLNLAEQPELPKRSEEPKLKYE
jgi:hypothetical protein